MSKFGAEVVKVDNGFIFKGVGEEDDFTKVFEENGVDVFEEERAFVRMVRGMMDYFCVRGSKHDAKRIVIDLVDQN